MSAYYELDLQKLVSIRKGKKISQKKLAEMTGLSIGTIQGYEQGKFDPKRESLEKICSVLDIQPDAITKRFVGFDSPFEFEVEWYKDAQQYGQISGPAHPGPLGCGAAIFVNFQNLNDAGQRKLLEFAELLVKVPEFQK